MQGRLCEIDGKIGKSQLKSKQYRYSLWRDRQDLS